jgi:hypothetical protein
MKSKGKEPEKREQPYYSLDTSLFHTPIKYFDRGLLPVPVRGKIHTSEERYTRSKAEREIVPIETLSGIHTYIHMKPYVQVPQQTLTIGLFNKPKQYADMEPAIGTVISSQETGHNEIEIGNAQGYYYHPDKILVIWECYLFSHFYEQRRPDTEDPNQAKLWVSFEKFLLHQFPDAKKITTPWHDPMFEDTAYEAFLQCMGYEKIAQAAYGKTL